MASFMPAACNPCAIDRAIERLLATPKTTAFLPCRSADIGLLGKGAGYQCGTGSYHGYTASWRHRENKSLIDDFDFCMETAFGVGNELQRKQFPFSPCPVSPVKALNRQRSLA